MLINKELIDLSLNASGKKEVIEALADMAYKAGRVNDKSNYVNAVLKREEDYSTAVGFGVAIPHGKTDAVTEPFLGFAKVTNVDWEALDNKPVDLIFIIGVPEKEAGSLHLKILASLSRKLMKEEFRKQLREVNSGDKLIKVLIDNEIGI